MENLDIGRRVIATHPTMGRDYATVAGPGSRPETIMINVKGRYYNPQEWPRERVQITTAGRDMVPGDLIDIGTLKEIFEQPFLGTLWTDGDSGILTPYVCECFFGDGLKLIKIFTINQRPNYHVVRVDSSWHEFNWHDGPTVGEHIDDILTAIEEECGPARPYCETCESSFCDCDWPDGYSARDAFPALDDENGCSWSEVSWPWLMNQMGIPK